MPAQDGSIAWTTGGIRKRRWLRIAAYLLIVVGAALVFHRQCIRDPTHEELTAHFETHRGTFMDLALRLSEDEIGRLLDDGACTGWCGAAKPTRERIDRLVARMRDAGIHGIERNLPPGGDASYTFRIVNPNLDLTTGSIVYEPGDPPVDSSDVAGVSMRRIESCWYTQIRRW